MSAEHGIAHRAARQRWTEGHPSGATIRDAAALLIDYDDDELREYAEPQCVTPAALRALLREYVGP